MLKKRNCFRTQRKVRTFAPDNKTLVLGVRKAPSARCAGPQDNKFKEKGLKIMVTLLVFAVVAAIVAQAVHLGNQIDLK